MTDKRVPREPVGWLHPDWLRGEYHELISPITTYETRGWIPLYVAPAVPDGATHYDPVEANAICHDACAIEALRRERARCDALKAALRELVDARDAVRASSSLSSIDRIIAAEDAARALLAEGKHED